MSAAEDAKCCRLSLHPMAAIDLAERQSELLADDNCEWVDCLPQYVLPCCRCALPAGPQTFNDTCSDAPNHTLLTGERYKDLSKGELKELQLAVLVDLQILV